LYNNKLKRDLFYPDSAQKRQNEGISDMFVQQIPPFRHNALIDKLLPSRQIVEKVNGGGVSAA
jgi:hypothetical protein